MILLSSIYWDPKPEIFKIPFLNFPVLWYGLLFALGFALGFPIFVDLLTRFLGKKKDAVLLTDRITVYMIVATIVGARVGHFLFYESPSTYLNDPFEILRIWEGGLASHGAAVGILIALFLFRYRHKVSYPTLTWVKLLDFIAIPTALAGFFIRIGNFFNQEILGTETSLPWAVVFGHPADRSLPVPRHPVQLYEACFYLAVFLFLRALSFKPSYLFAKGRLIGIFLILVFGFRFLIEFFKEEQSELIASSAFTMGQFLSLPILLLGVFFYFFSYRKG
jgi:phosphatidylglycerol:prolipoprotein diacylglycerol transferase